VAFSAAWRENSGMNVLWNKEDLQLVTSVYALTEAQRNIALKKPSASARLSLLLSTVEVSTLSNPLGSDHRLPDRDRPILNAALGSACSILLTSDTTHFGHLIGTEIDGVKIMTVSMFLDFIKLD
jgi:hypothetical protein